MATSWGQRKALGRRYGTDPALLMEMERLEKEYSLAPGREARAIQREQMGIQQSQFDRSLKTQEDAQSQAATAGMIGTAGNILVGGPMAYYAGKSAGLWGNPSQPVAGATKVAGMEPAAAPTGTVSSLYREPSMWFGGPTVDPATIDATQAGLAAGADVGMGTTAAASGTATAPTAWSTYGVPGMQALAAYEGSRAASGFFKEDTFANRALRDPLTGVLGEGMRAVGLKGAADQVNRWEKDIIQKPMDTVVDTVTNFVSDIFGW